MKVVLGLMVLLLVAATARAAFVETVYTATLTGTQIVPYNGDNTHAGTAVCIYNRNLEPKTLECEVQHNLQSPVGAFIAIGPRGEAGATIFTFTVTLNKNFKQIFVLSDLTDYSVSQQERDFLNGNWYVQVASDDYPDGEIRGQIEHEDRFYAKLSTRNTIPRASGSTAHGIAVGTYSFWDPKRDLAVDIVHDIVNPTSAEVRQGAPGEVGPLIYTYKAQGSPLFSNVQLTVGEQTQFLEDLLYLNIKSSNNPSGEIRGQIVTIDYIEDAAFTAKLTGDQEVPPLNTKVSGCAIVTYDCETRVMEYLVMHDLRGASGALVQAAPQGKSGSARFSLSRVQSPIYGEVQLTLEEEFLLYTGQLYFNLLHPNAPTGAIRGQINVDRDFWSYLSGTNVVPPVTTSAVGCGTFEITGDSKRVLNYDIHHSVADPTIADIRISHEGANGKPTQTFASVVSPISGEDIIFDDDELQDYIDGDLYVLIRSTQYPLGEIRGQIYRVNPCVVTRDDQLTLPEGAPSVVISTGLSSLITTNNGNSPSTVANTPSSGSPASTASTGTTITNSVVVSSRYGQSTFFYRASPDASTRDFNYRYASSTPDNNNSDSGSASTLAISMFSLILAIVLAIFA